MIELMCEMELVEIGNLVNNFKMGYKIVKLFDNFFILSIEVEIVFLNWDVLRIRLFVIFDFCWNDYFYGILELYYIWVENLEMFEIYYYEFFIFSRRRLYDDYEFNFMILLSDLLLN